MTINNELIDFLLNNHKPGIVAFINEVDKKVLVMYRKSIISGIMDVLKDCILKEYEYKDFEEDYNTGKITINILQTYDYDISEQLLKLQHTKFVDMYKDYKHYNGTRKALKYKVRTSVDATTGFVYVQLVNASNKKITVGVFKNFEQSEKFVSEHYKQPIYNIVS